MQSVFTVSADLAHYSCNFCDVLTVPSEQAARPFQLGPMHILSVTIGHVKEAMVLPSIQAHSPSAGTAESQMPSPLSWRIGRAATLLKTLLQYYGKSLEALPGVAYPSFRDNHSTLNTKTGYKKNSLVP